MWAVGGLLSLTGDPDRPPVRVSFPQTLLFASLSAAVGAVVAHWHRLRTGQGQWVDASAQQSLVRLLSNATPMYDLNRETPKREGAIRWGAGGRRSRMMWPCRDGFVAFMTGMGPAQGRSSRALLAWMREEGMPAPDLEALPWETMLAQDTPPDLLEHIQETFGAFFRTKSKGELWQGAVARRILLFPAGTPQDLAHFPQLEARRWWTPVEHEDLGITLPYPGPAVASTYAPMGIRRRAPHLGEHNREVYMGELGLTAQQMATLRQAGVI
ncbi:Succinyl-CoA:(R)-benzylsuccinate CoA-transferase subunit BbsE [bacterium HR23]|nr:Succinyl-CoA:(R)-benzylsuccinate CoA-transferase subunit BbsE [bacterium HR23]